MKALYSMQLQAESAMALPFFMIVETLIIKFI
jgi:hypothetical protein